MFSITTANLNGIRSAVRKGFLEWMHQSGSHFVCVQEIKAQPDDIVPAIASPDLFHGHFGCAEKKGYSGVGIYSKTKPDKVIRGFGCPEFDAEGRYLQCDYKDFSLVSLYAPSGSSSPERQEAKFRFMDHFFPFLEKLKESEREFIICGDWNIAHKEIDLKNWKSNQKNSGFLPEERAWLSRILDELGLIDVYRCLHPDTTDASYTWWSNRGQAWQKNVGWRIDYQIATPGIAGKAVSASIYKETRFSDHAPLTIWYDIPI
ncbi:exodeoxyribonuclease III [Oxalobacter paraformigenes]|uniref:Exodeoxyribonuclease III (Xth) n=1 Tax=Oxalobacter paraformigenes TaxID=556268 RepID=C3X5L1_9BURK|nr:exodeoxyribonuclease III [Oxalobacter paraformigenes]EEO28497.1 exodeoxyribonuclease III (xth) [Oxalobacter paraformigenes]